MIMSFILPTTTPPPTTTATTPTVLCSGDERRDLPLPLLSPTMVVIVATTDAPTTEDTIEDTGDVRRGQPPLNLLLSPTMGMDTMAMDTVDTDPPTMDMDTTGDRKMIDNTGHF